MQLARRERTRLRALVLAVDLAALVALVLVPAEQLATRPLPLLLLAALAALGGSRTVRFPGLKTAVTASHPFVIVALLALGPLGAALVAGVGALAGGAVREARTPTIRLAFNVGAVTLSVAVAGALLFALGARPGVGLATALPPLLAAAGAYFLINTGLVAGAIALETGRRWLATWTRSCRLAGASFFAGVVAGATVYGLYDLLLPWGLAVGLLSAWLLSAFHRWHAVRLDARGAP